LAQQRGRIIYRLLKQMHLISEFVCNLLDRLPRQSAKYALMIGAGVGLITGGLQDVIRYNQGQKIWYLEKK